MKLHSFNAYVSEWQNMNYLKRVLIDLALSGFLIVLPVDALSNQGLEWGTPIEFCDIYY
jgi:hypothetical protein